jgi:hypothetical protein
MMAFMKRGLLTSPTLARINGQADRQSGKFVTGSRKLLKRYRDAFAVSAAILSIFVSASLAFSEPLANRIAEDPAIKGKGKDGACMDYAIALSSKLAANGIHGRLIFYRWHIRTNGITGSHVFVVYHLGDGTEWIVDNEIAAPKQVPDDATPMQLVFLLSGDPSAPVDVELQNGLNHLSFF